jgi:hypothetical protein
MQFMVNFAKVRVLSTFTVQMNDINDRLIRSVVQGDISEAQALLDQGAEANTSGVNALGGCNTALMWAATEGL